MEAHHPSSRRKFIKAGGIVIAASAIGGAARVFAKEEEKENNQVSPPEDLMREHGVLKRILLVYGEALRRMGANEDLPSCRAGGALGPTIRLRRAAKMGNDANGSKTVEQAQPEEYPVGDFTRLRDAQGGIN